MKPLRSILSRQFLLIQLPLMGLLLVGVWLGTRQLLLDRAVREGQTALSLAGDTLGRRLTSVERAGRFLSEWWRQGRIDLREPESVAALLMPWLEEQADLLVLNLVDETGRSVLFIRDEETWKAREVLLDPRGGRMLRWRRAVRTGLLPPDHPLGPPGPYDARLRPWYVEARALTGPKWSKAYNYDPPASKHVFTWMVPMPRTALPGGAIGLDVLASSLDRMLDDLRPTPGSALWILDGQGAALASSSTGQARRHAIPGPGRHAFQGEAHQVLTIGLQGHPGAPWTVVVAIPEREMLASARGRLWGITGLAALILGLSLAWILGQGARLAGEIGALAEAARTVGTGSGPVLPETRVMEFGSLGEALHRAHGDMQQREELQRQLLHSQRLETLGTLAGGIAHDVNNQLGAILGHLQLAEEASTAAAFGQRLSKAKAAVERCAATTGALVTFGHRGRSHVRPVDLNDLVSETAVVLNRILGGRIEVRLDLGSPLPVLQGEPQQLEQVLMNLAVNARDAMPEGGTLTFQTRKGEGATLELRVTDTGEGIAPEVLPHIFEPFYTTKPIGEGSGLGLAMVYGVVQSHGGTITARSRLGEGTDFLLTFPGSEDGKADQEPAARVLPRPEAGAWSILLAEDEDDLRELLADALTFHGAEVVAARDGEEAWEAYRAGTFDCVVSDQRMPRCTGTELLARIRATEGTLPFILISGQDLEAHRQAWSQDAAVAFLAKPFSIAALMGQVEAMV